MFALSLHPDNLYLALTAVFKTAGLKHRALLSDGKLAQAIIVGSTLNDAMAQS